MTRRIEAGARMIESGQYSFSMAHRGSTPFDVTGAPMRTWTTGDTEALGLSPESAAMLVAAAAQTFDAASGKAGNYLRAWPVDGSPLGTATTTAELGLAVPPAVISKHHGGVDYAAIEHMNKSVGDPLSGVVTRPNMSVGSAPGMLVPAGERGIPTPHRWLSRRARCSLGTGMGW